MSRRVFKSAIVEIIDESVASLIWQEQYDQDEYFDILLQLKETMENKSIAKLLVDSTNMKGIRRDNLTFTEELFQSIAQSVPKINIAVVKATNFSGVFSMNKVIENIKLNGIDLQIFESSNEALNWLQNKK